MTVKRIVVTGQIGAGKSAVCAEFVRLGVPAISADEIARLMVAPNQAGWVGLRNLFGETVFNADGSVNRKKLAGIVFEDAYARAELEKLLHPLIRARIEQEISGLGNVASVVVEIPLYSGSDSETAADVVVVVTAPWQMREARLIAERGYTPREAAVRSEAQGVDDKRLEFADFVIVNNGSPDHLAREVRRVDEAIKETFGTDSAKCH